MKLCHHNSLQLAKAPIQERLSLIHTPTATTSATARVHRCSASHATTPPAVFRSQDTAAPMMSGKAAAAFPASAFSHSPSFWSCFLNHSFAPLGSGFGGSGFGGSGFGGSGLGSGLGVGLEVTPSALVMERTIVEIMNPSAVIRLAIVTPCSRNKVLILSASVVSELRT